MLSTYRGIGPRRAIAATILALPVLHWGCSTPTAPVAPPGGGQTAQLSFETFESEVLPTLTWHGCDAGGDCHGGGIRGSLQLSPQGAKDAQFDFDQVVLQVDPLDPQASPILTEPLALAAGGTAHGFKPFDSTDHGDYQAILDWILDGDQP